MAEDLDVDAMLEESFKKPDKEKNGEEKPKKSEKEDKDRKKSKKSKDKKRSKSRSHSRNRKSRSRSRDKRSRSRSRDRRSRSRSRDRRSRSRSRDRKSRRSDKDRKEREKERKERDEKRREKEKEREKEREERRREREKEREKEREERRKREEIERGRNVAKLDDYKGRRSSSKRDGEADLTPEERDLRTVFCMQLASRIRPRDLEEFFSSIGKVKDVRLILDNKSHRSKGIAYIEFKDIESVALAIGLSGQKLLGVPIIVQNAHAERNRQASTNQPASVTLAPGAPALKPAVPDGPGKLYVGMLHPNISEEMLNGIFEPFGKVSELKLVKDSSGVSAGYGFITYALSEDAKKAMTQLDGFELAGKAIKVGFVTEKTGEALSYTSSTGVAMVPPTTNEATPPTKTSGFNMGPSTRLHLMTKLAEGSDLKVPSVTSTLSEEVATDSTTAPPPIATQCFMLSNMFSPETSLGDTWQQDMRDEMIEEFEKYGGIVHIFVDSTSSDGNIYVKGSSVATAIAAVNALHGRFFAGRQIRAAYIPLPNYHTLFPDSVHVYNSLKPSSSQT